MTRKGIKTSKIWLIPDEEFITYFKECNSVRHLMSLIGLSDVGSNRNTLKARLESLSLRYDEIKYKRIAVSITRKPLEEYLTINSTAKRDNLKKRLVKEKLLEYRCYICELGDVWNGEILALQLDHINGIRNDNRLNNLRFLCPNCHSQTDTFAGKRHKKPIKEKVIKPRKRKFDPSREELAELIQKMPCSKVAEIYGVSDNAVGRRCKLFGIDKPGRGYWNKVFAGKL